MWRRSFCFILNISRGIMWTLNGSESARIIKGHDVSKKARISIIGLSQLIGSISNTKGLVRLAILLMLRLSKTNGLCLMPRSTPFFFFFFILYIAMLNQLAWLIPMMGRPDPPCDRYGIERLSSRSGSGHCRPEPAPPRCHPWYDSKISLMLIVNSGFTTCFGLVWPMFLGEWAWFLTWLFRGLNLIQ